MVISQETVIYLNPNHKKLRWISYVTAIQLGFIVVNLVFMPTTRNRLSSGSKKTKDSPFVDDDTKDETNSSQDYSRTSAWVGVKKLNYGEIVSVRNVIDNFKEKPYFCGGMVLASGMITTALLMFAKRNAHKITLLPNDRIRFSTFSPLGIGEAPFVEIPLRDVSCVTPRHTKDNFSVLKFRDHIGYHLVSKSEGHFLEPQLYDEYLGYSRSWAKR